MRRIETVFAVALAIFGAPGCGEHAAWWAAPAEGALPPMLSTVSQSNKALRDLPAAREKVAVAVYGFTDQTGQMKASDTLQTLSRAVTQGAGSILVKALKDAGNGKWFTVVERERIDNLLKERRIIQETRQIYLGEKEINKEALPPLLLAGILLDGGIIGYDTNTHTGGIGARYLGIGADATYREHTVTIALRAISTKSGEVLGAVEVHKTVLSYGLQGNTFKYVSLTGLLESDIGFSKNEPDQIAIQEAVEKAVRTLVIDGAERKLWAFSDRAAQNRLIAEYHQEQFGDQNRKIVKAEATIPNE